MSPRNTTSVPSTEKAGPAPSVVLPSTPAAASDGNRRTGRAGHSDYPTCHRCDGRMRKAEGVVPLWRCACGNEIPYGVPSDAPKHVVMFSGGEGSWAAAQRVAEKHGTENLKLLFADTLMEHFELTRFLVAGAADIAGVDARPLLARLDGLPKVGDPRRALWLSHYWSIVHKAIPMVQPLVEGRTIWQVFHDNRFLGNSRLANCSKFLKQEPARAWLEANTDPANTHVYVGIDWSEIHRLPDIVAAYEPWQAHAPLCEKPYLSKDDVAEMVNARGIPRSRAYALGFPHNNCSGFCVRAGQGQFAILLRTDRELYLYHEAEEQKLRDYLGKDVAIMRDRSGGEVTPLTMRTFRERIDAQGTLWVDMDDVGGCGCFTAAATPETPEELELAA